MSNKTNFIEIIDKFEEFYNNINVIKIKIPNTVLK